MSECICGREIEQVEVPHTMGDPSYTVEVVWRHVTGDSVYCYPEEAGLDHESRCTAMPEYE